MLFILIFSLTMVDVRGTSMAIGVHISQIYLKSMTNLTMGVTMMSLVRRIELDHDLKLVVDSTTNVKSMVWFPQVFFRLKRRHLEIKS